MRVLIKNQFIKNRPGKVVLDYGCGHGRDAAWLRELGYIAIGYDPYQENFNHPELMTAHMEFDTILCTYVLNVVDQKEEIEILHNIRQLLKPTGHAFFTVRRDIKPGTTKIGTNGRIQRYIIMPEGEEIKVNRAARGKPGFATFKFDRGMIYARERYLTNKEVRSVRETQAVLGA